MVDGVYTMCDPVASTFVILDLIPVVVFEVEFNGKIHAFEKDEVSNVVTNLQPGGVL